MTLASVLKLSTPKFGGGEFDNTPETDCPACRAHAEDGNASQGFVVAAAKALVEGDDENVMALMKASTPFDFHVAVTMLVNYMDIVASHTDSLTIEFLDRYRELLDEDIRQGL